MATQTKPRVSRKAHQPEQTPEEQTKAEKQAAEMAKLETQIEERKGQQAAEPEATPEPAKPAKAPARPVGTLDLNPQPVVYFRPSVRVGNDTHTCPHTAFGHETEKSAMVCARKLAAEHGAVLAKPEAPKA
jgi:hypothetical protein